MKMTGTYRTDGLDSPMSPNSGRMTWETVERMCEASGAVESYDRHGDTLTVVYCDGNVSTFSEPIEAANEIQQM
jgi:prepilin-type processing-associated H-X9-DG protein